MSRSIVETIFTACLAFSVSVATAADAPDDHAKQLAGSVTIHRDEWGVAHILGPTDECVVFGMGYAQAEDYFWQVEDTAIRALGRYAEVQGDAGLPVDLLNRSFEVVSRSKADFERIPVEQQTLIAAFTHGLNWYLQRHPETPRRLIQTFEPWMVIAIERHLLLDFTYSQTHAGRPQILFDPNQTAQMDEVLSPLEQAARDAVGSNEWAIGPSKTANGKAMLLINPHQPWHGWGQFYEA
ncbi:MAG: penicillin acylase family protein, partial [Fuerstia sp.]|nr:penicillin acylase family protein [Fuerstiella sp.]